MKTGRSDCGNLRVDLLGAALVHETGWRGLRLGTADRLPVRLRGSHSFADLAFPGSLYVDMIPEGVPVRWGSFPSAVS